MCAHREWSSETFWSATGTGTVTIRPRSSPCDRRSGHGRMVHHFPLAGEREKWPANYVPTLCDACARSPRHQWSGRHCQPKIGHSPRPSDLTARFQRPAAVYSRPRYSPLYPGTVNSEPGAGRSGFRATGYRACTHPHPCTLHRTVQGGTDTTSRAADTANSL